MVMRMGYRTALRVCRQLAGKVQEISIQWLAWWWVANRGLHVSHITSLSYIREVKASHCGTVRPVKVDSALHSCAHRQQRLETAGYKRRKKARGHHHRRHKVGREVRGGDQEELSEEVQGDDGTMPPVDKSEFRITSPRCGYPS